MFFNHRKKRQTLSFRVTGYLRLKIQQYVSGVLVPQQAEPCMSAYCEILWREETIKRSIRYSHWLGALVTASALKHSLLGVWWGCEEHIFGSLQKKKKKKEFQNPPGSKCLNFPPCFRWKRYSAPYKLPLRTVSSLSQYGIIAPSLSFLHTLSQMSMENGLKRWSLSTEDIWKKGFGPEQEKLPVRNPAPDRTVPNSQGLSMF